MIRFRTPLVVALAAVLSTAGFVVSSQAPHVGAAPAALDPSTLGMRPSGGFLDAGRLQQYETTLDQPIRWYVAMADRGSPEKMRSSVWGQLQNGDAVLPTVADRMDIVMTVPLAFGKGDANTATGRASIRQRLLETAAGRWDDDFRAVAQSLVAGGYPDAVIRLGHEFTGHWYPWSAQGNPDAYIAAYRHVHDVLLAESPALRFEWNAARNTFGEFGPPAYPGNNYVDVIGLDVYYEPWKGDPSPFTEDVWTRRYEKVMSNHRDFAIAHGKPLSYAEWAIGDVDEPAFIEAMHGWFSSLPASGGGSLLYHSYFNVGNATYNLDNYPRSKARYVELFGGADVVAQPPSTTTVPATTVPATTVPVTTAPVTTVPATTAPATTVPATTVPVPVPSPPATDGGPSIELADALTVPVGEPVTIDATIVGDGIRWWKVSGPSIGWVDQGVERPTVTFSTAGTYELGVRAALNGEIAKSKIVVTATTGVRTAVISPTTPSSTVSSAVPAVSVRSAAAVEGDSLVFKIVLSEPVDHPVSVRLITQDLTAAVGADFAPLIADRVIIAANTKRVFVGVPTLSDRLPEGVERMRLKIVAADGATIGVAGGIGRISD